TVPARPAQPAVVAGGHRGEVTLRRGGGPGGGGARWGREVPRGSWHPGGGGCARLRLCPSRRAPARAVETLPEVSSSGRGMLDSSSRVADHRADPQRVGQTHSGSGRVVAG